MISTTQIIEILSQFGELRQQTISDWYGEIALPKQIEDFYLEVGPVDLKIDSIGNPYHIPSLSRLWKYQVGYRWDNWRTIRWMKGRLVGGSRRRRGSFYFRSSH